MDKIVRWKNKIGDYIGLIKHTQRYKGEQLAMVKFVGNRKVSRVPYKDLEFITGIEALKNNTKSDTAKDCI